MTQNHLCKLIAISLGLMLNACGSIFFEPENSSDLLTSEIRMELELNSTAMGTSCRASFFHGDKPVVLTGEDTITCSDGAEVELSRTYGDFGSESYSYVGTGLRDYDSTRHYTFSFRRKNGKVIEASLSAPKEIKLSSPSPDAVVPGGQDLLVEWDQGDAKDLVFIWLSLGSAAELKVSDTGSATLPASVVRPSGIGHDVLYIQKIRTQKFSDQITITTTLDESVFFYIQDP